MKEMQVGDIGVLQNFNLFAYLNGSVVTVNDPLGMYNVTHLTTGFTGDYIGYGIRCPLNPEMEFCTPDQIRPITNPDAEQTKERVMVS